MKRILSVLAIASIIFVSGCSGSPAESSGSSSSAISSEQSHEVVLDNVGLTYTTPAQWAEFEKTNLYPLTIQSEGTLARIIYNYVSEENIKKLEDLNDTTAYTQYLTPICEIMIAPTENFTNGSVEKLTSLYKNQENTGSQNGYSYYVLYPCAEVNLEGDDLKNYNIIADAVPDLISSISTREFNPEDVKPIIDTSEINNYITFDTVTLDGEKINSSVFGEYDLTMVNFWGTYALDKSNEQAVLQEVYEQCQNLEGKKVNVINAIVDTPNAETEGIVKQLKEEAGGKFTTLVMDDVLANWTVENLEGVPTTVFVNPEGKIISEQLKGAKSADSYMEKIEYYLEEEK